MNRNFSRLESLIDLYSNLGVGHASFMIACMIGLFSILGLLKNNVFELTSIETIPYILLNITYWGVWLVGFYCLLKFFWNIEYAKAIEQYLLKNNKIIEGELEDIHKNMWSEGLIKKRINYRTLKDGLLKTHTSDLIFCGYFLLGLFPFLSIIITLNMKFWIISGIIGGLFIIFGLFTLDP